MRIGVFGTGTVGKTIGSKLVQLGHDVMMGSRTKDNAEGVKWTQAAGSKAQQGTFADAAAFGELLFNCTSGGGSLSALEQAGATNLDGKVLVDISNPLDFSKGMPPSLFVSNTDSLGEQIQRTYPGLRVVKALNTINCELMVNPGKLHGGNHDVFMAGNDGQAKAQVASVLREWFGWKNIVDLGDITGARATESYLHLWLRLFVTQKSANFNLHLVRE